MGAAGRDAHMVVAEAQLRRAAKSDRNQQAIMDRLRQIGARVIPIKEPVDLLVGYRGHTVLLEVKAEGGRLTEQQVQFIAGWIGGPVHIVKGPDEAASLVVDICKEPA